MATTVMFYSSERRMKTGIKIMSMRGWTVASTEVVEQGYGCLKTGCLGILFLPLALLGKKPVRYQVTYTK
jgi:hypothetical protein